MSEKFSSGTENSKQTDKQTIVKNDGTMELCFTMEKIWYYTENYGTSIYNRKKYGNIPEQLQILNNYISFEL